MKKMNDAVDIIIPVYNGYEDLQRCIPSVLRHTDLNTHRLVLINDCSPDPRIAPCLDAMAGEHVLVIHNEKNLGFSGNVNKGMQLSEDRDVLLLNSDTVVTAGWLDKIIACAYRDASTGTVTPLSNSATLCSVPVMCQDNPVPEHLSIDEYGALIERCSLHRYPRITVAVGFCMYIKRCVIRDVGLFDAETFGRGYGEENDFCNRAEMLGYHHVMCDDTFVYHRGTASFDTEEKRALLEAHDAILRERYGAQMEQNHRYCLENPDQEIRDNISLYTRLQNGKKNLLYVLHLDFRERAMSNTGGTQIHVRELMESFRRDCNVFVAARDGSYLNVTIYTETDEIPLRFEIGETPLFPVFHDETLERIFRQILQIFAIDLVHVHHTQNLSLDIYHAADALGIPVAATLHDYYYVCPTILLLEEGGTFCAAQNAHLTLEEQEARCRRCLHTKKQIVPQADYLRVWRREHARALAICRQIILPSQSARDIILEYYPQIREKTVVVEHGEDRMERLVTHADVPKGAKHSPRLKARIDSVAGKGQGLNDIKGWAYLEGVDNEETEIFVELTDRNGVADCFHISKVARPDIVDAFGTPDALMCGIDLRVSSDRLSDGPVRIRIYVRCRDELYQCRETFRGEYRRRFGEAHRLNVAFLGGMVEQKGSRTARALIPMDRETINWFVFGDIGDLSMLEIQQDNCFFSGKYQKEEIPQLLSDHRIDVVCILPVWPETFCYTVSEAWMNGVPVLGTDIGAVGERIRRTGGGWTVPVDAAPEDILKKLHEIAEHPEELEKRKNLVAAMPQKSVADMCETYRQIYGAVQAETEQTKTAQTETEQAKTAQTEAEQLPCDYELIFQGLALGNPAIGGKDGAARLNRLKNENAALKASIDVLKGTTSYRLARKIAEGNIPFKEPLKKAIRRCRKH
jgi:GT2 family glycosyltransferase/glycosyltransferase involved in cell wall biosynthesis